MVVVLESYADALRSLGVPLGPSCSHALPAIAPQLSVQGISLALPLENAAAFCPTSSWPRLALLPSTDLVISNAEWLQQLETDVRSVVATRLALRAPFRMVLSHLALDATGHDDAFAVAAPPAGAFSTLLVPLPSVHSGGDLSLLRDDGVPHAEALPSGAWVVFDSSRYAHAEPIYSGVCATLVFSLVYTSPAMPSRSSKAVAALKALAQTTFQYHARIGIPLSRAYRFGHVFSRAALDVANLRGVDAAILDALEDSGAFDVALVSVTAHRTRCAMDGVQSWYVDKAVFPSGTTMPTHMQGDVLWADVDGWIHTKFAHGPFALVFWPKTHRLRLYRHQIALFDLGCAIAGEPSDMKGYTDATAMAHAVLEMVSAEADVGHAIRCRVCSAENDAHTPYTTRLLRLLLQLNDANLVATFLHRASQCEVHARMTAKTMGPLLYHCGERYGWTTLSLALQHFCRRHASSDLPYIWLASLLGRSEDPVCPVLSHPIELVSQCFVALVDAKVPDLNGNRDGDRDMTLLQHALLLQSHLTSLDVAERQPLAAKLPAPLVVHVHSFLLPRDLVEFVMRGRMPGASVLAPALAFARRHDPRIPLAPYAKLLFDKTRCSRRTASLRSMTGRLLLVVTDCPDRLGDIVDDAPLWLASGDVIIAAICAVAEVTSPYTWRNDVRAALTAMVLRAPSVLLETTRYSFPPNSIGSTGGDEGCNGRRVAFACKALEFTLTWAPEKSLSLAKAIVSGLLGRPKSLQQQLLAPLLAKLSKLDVLDDAMRRLVVASTLAMLGLPKAPLSPDTDHVTALRVALTIACLCAKCSTRQNDELCPALRPRTIELLGVVGAIPATTLRSTDNEGDEDYQIDTWNRLVPDEDLLSMLCEVLTPVDTRLRKRHRGAEDEPSKSIDQ
ncbi:hypothetical protein SPRG_06031 [Saprolegnia parasitica CBS 223.65]|uniref:Prolyl 4-hydroxylase alpha subunit Fe(2+) 2OG dioxygenase domain-containing protein n=1 Tax=Saprolegnia parasitica (strain CBS 223.65) TaxID=695850 RepID=A0A067CSH6_SAPPC|nr:hypothetical protein SPRG_06031 [Saprolegnia parasitica CBS 223.65]KDO29491.1 hypothetical protein SPRG_06031 [Saprolegnia parasitica CBS 223.65]|eukprot:XP_012199987.1 hypothetical protein SPRG_06031 [Saprolegnia parasitica CBS 223.65]